MACVGYIVVVGADLMLDLGNSRVGRIASAFSNADLGWQPCLTPPRFFRSLGFILNPGIMPERREVPLQPLPQTVP